jgi:hypothetical protein
MHSATIDAGVLAAPPLTANREEVYQYVDTLLDWQRLLDEPWISIYMSERASQTLIEQGLFPLRDPLKALFSSKSIVEYSVNDVAVVAERLLSLTPSFETYFCVKDVLLENLATEPELLSLTVGEGMASDLGRCIVLLAILRNYCRNLVNDHTLILKRSPISGQVIVKAIIHAIEHERDDLYGIPAPPEIFEGVVLTCQDFRGLILCINESAVWITAQDPIGKGLAVRIAVYKSRIDRRIEPDWDELPSFMFGERFVDIAGNICSRNMNDLVPKLLRSIVETLDRQNMGAVHPLREHEGGGSPQRERSSDGAKAWRRDIDYEYHLHYWQCDGGVIEFGSIGPHNDFQIPE